MSTTRLGSQNTMVDLHGLSIDKAHQAVNWHISTAAQTNTLGFRFVTGRGNHVNHQGERGVLFREFNNWLAEENLQKIKSIHKGNGYYEVQIKPTEKTKPNDNLIKQLSREWLVNNAEKIKELALANEAYYQFLLGYSYQYGIGRDKYLKEAVAYYKKSAAQNDIFAQYALAGCYWQGVGVRQNDTIAIQLFEKAAEKNLPWALHQMGDNYYYGDGVKKDLKKAKDYYERASELGVIIATRKLAHLYIDENEVGNDLAKAFLLYKKAADQGDAHAAFNVACAYLHEYGVEQDVKLSFEYAQLAAELNDPDAQYLVGECYSLGRGVNQDLEKSYYYMQCSANNNHRHAMFQLAMHNSNSKDVRQEYLLKAAKAAQVVAQAMVVLGFYQKPLSATERDEIESSFWKQANEEVVNIPADKYKIVVLDAYLSSSARSAKQHTKILNLLNMLIKNNCPEACLRLGMLYKQGERVKQSDEKAKELWLKGAKQGNSNCLCSLGYLYEEKAKADPSQLKIALDYHQQACEMGNANSCNQLGIFYHHGKGVEKNLKTSAEYYMQAIKLEENAESQAIVSIFNSKVLPDATHNLATLHWFGGENFAPNKQQAVAWFLQSARAGNQDAQKFLMLIGNPAYKNSNSSLSKMSIWDAQPIDQLSKEKYILDALAKFSRSLIVESKWKVTKDGDAWSYISSDDVARLNNYDLKPFSLSNTKDGRKILLLKKCASQNLDLVTNTILLQPKLKK